MPSEDDDESVDELLAAFDAATERGQTKRPMGSRAARVARRAAVRAQERANALDTKGNSLKIPPHIAALGRTDENETGP